MFMTASIQQICSICAHTGIDAPLWKILVYSYKGGTRISRNVNELLQSPSRVYSIGFKAVIL